MTPQKALDILREHLTTLNANPRMYEDGTHDVIQALEEYVMPHLEDEVQRINDLDELRQALIDNCTERN